MNGPFHKFHVKLTPDQEQLGLNLDRRLSFDKYITDKTNNVIKGTGLLRKLQSVLPHTSLFIKSKSIVRPHLDYRDVSYDQPSNNHFN